MGKSQREKGKRGERQCRDVWKAHGFDETHRSQQFCGRGESAADVVGVDDRLHIECKLGYSYKKIYEFTKQAQEDAKDGQIPIVNCRMDGEKWLCVLSLEDFIRIWKGEIC